MNEMTKPAALLTDDVQMAGCFTASMSTGLATRC